MSHKRARTSDDTNHGVTVDHVEPTGEQKICSRKKRKRSRSTSLTRARKLRHKEETTSPRVSQPRSYRISCWETWLWAPQLEQHFILPSREHSYLLAALRRPLPVSFRIRTTAAASEWKTLLQERRGRSHDDDNSSCIVALPSIFANGWQVPADVVRHDVELQRWMARNTISGAASRQEFVSMIPVALLQLASHHAVLDMCASPGSKTIQAVDSLYQNTSSTSRGRVTGFVVANELDPRRAYTLAHRCRKTLAERHQALAIVCHNAAKFPNVLAPLTRVDNNKTTPPSPLPYDRIICDVPCSGDGTLRKDLKVWRTWHPEYGIGLHALQLRIAKRGIALLKVGGLMTYSTCSFHPIENEAVVASLLQTGCVELVSPRLPGVSFRHGMTSWAVVNHQGQEIAEKDRPGDWPATLWPSQNPLNQQLVKCVRMVPHDNDTGGFFIALLRKTKEWEPSSTKNTSSHRHPPLVTPQPDHHCLYLVEASGLIEDEGSVEEDVQFFRRSRTGTNVVAINTTLADHLVGQVGSARLHHVSMGRRVDSANDA